MNIHSIAPKISLNCANCATAFGSRITAASRTLPAHRLRCSDALRADVFSDLVKFQGKLSRGRPSPAAGDASQGQDLHSYCRTNGSAYRRLKYSSAGIHGLWAPSKPANFPPVHGLAPCPATETRDLDTGESPN